MGDVKDILGISVPKEAPSKFPTFKKRSRSTGPPSAAPPDSKKKKQKKTRLSREIALLTAHPAPGQQTTSLVETKNFKEKRKIAPKPAEKWLWRPFHSTARHDGQVFYHWSKATEPYGDYRFAALNKKVEVFDYDDKDYNTYFASDNWTREETNYLMDLCRTYDLNWFVISDRWSYPTRRTIEELKERYYSIQQKLIRLIVEENKDSFLQSHPLLTNSFDKQQDINRKKQQEYLLRRDRRQINEENELVEQGTSIMNSFKQHRKDAVKVIKLSQQVLKGTLVEPKKVGRPPKRGRRGRPPSNPLISSTKSSKLQPFIKQGLEELGISKPDTSIVKSASKFKSIKVALEVFFELQEIQAQALYELQVFKEQRRMLIEDRKRRLGIAYDPMEADDSHAFQLSDNINFNGLISLFRIVSSHFTFILHTNVHSS
eukprot:TRINITY_DN5671_c0_g1_i1.p1 TRINITY_DN5671_c0_g1~~TRINITY_DN5671_c0_g1_i1.p1  ORF type:complete len:430 (+),score=84.79 TRINITY_DN5671_c0_g1_i1:118-1407(+)